MTTTRETVHILTRLDYEAKAREFTAHASRAWSRVEREVNADGEITFQRAADILREECPHISEGDALKLVKIYSNAR